MKISNNTLTTLGLTILLIILISAAAPLLMYANTMYPDAVGITLFFKSLIGILYVITMIIIFAYIIG